MHESNNILMSDNVYFSCQVPGIALQSADSDNWDINVHRTDGNMLLLKSRGIFSLFLYLDN